MAKPKDSTARDLQAQVDMRLGPDDGTVIIFDYVYDFTVPKKERTTYTFVAIWVAEKGRWFVSGEADNLVGKSNDHQAMMTILAMAHTVKAWVVTDMERFKP